MGWTLAQAWARTQVTVNATTATVTLSTPTTGNLLVSAFLWANSMGNSASLAVKDANNVAFTITPNSPSNTRSGSAGIAYLAYLQVPATPNGVITGTFGTTGAGGLATLWVAEYAPSSGSNGGFDSDSAGTGSTGTTINTPTLTVSQANDLCIIAALSDHLVSTVDSPWTQRAAGAGNQFAEGIGDILSQGSNVTAAMTQNTSSGWDSIAASFKFTASGSTAPIGVLEEPMQNSRSAIVMTAVRRSTSW